MKLGACNQIKGTITSVVRGQTTGHVHTGNGVTVDASIANEAADDLAIGEIDPRVEGRQVVVAHEQAGKEMPGLKPVVPEDRRGGRSV